MLSSPMYISRSFIINSCGSIKLRSYPGLTEANLDVHICVRDLMLIRNVQYNVDHEHDNLFTNGISTLWN